MSEAVKYFAELFQGKRNATVLLAIAYAHTDEIASATNRRQPHKVWRQEESSLSTPSKDKKWLAKLL